MIFCSQFLCDKRFGMEDNMIDKIKGYVFTEMEIQILASMMGKTKIYGFENQNYRDGDMLRKNTYESIYSLARKNYLEYVNKSSKISCPKDSLPINFDSICVKDDIVKLFRNIIKGKIILDIIRCDNMENVLMYIGSNDITVIRPNITNKKELIVCGIKVNEWYQFMLDEGYLPDESLKGLFAGTASITNGNDKKIIISMIDAITFDEIKRIRIYEDLSYDLGNDRRNMYSKNNILNEIGMR